MYDFVEFRVGSTGQKFVELYQQSVVQVGRGGCSASLALDSSSSVKINAHVDLLTKTLFKFNRN